MGTKFPNIIDEGNGINGGGRKYTTNDELNVTIGNLTSINILNYSKHVEQTTGSWSNAIAMAFIDASQDGKTIYFPSGTYLVDETIVMPPNVSIIGDGMRNTIIRLIVNSECNIIDFAQETYSTHSIQNLCVQGDIDMADSGYLNTPYTGTIEYIGINCGKTHTDQGEIDGSTHEVNGVFIKNVLIQRCFGHAMQMNKKVFVVRVIDCEIRQSYGAGIMNYGTDNIFSRINIYQCGYGLYCLTSGNNRYSDFKAYQNGVDPTIRYSAYVSELRGGVYLNACKREIFSNIECQENYFVNFRVISCSNIMMSSMISDSSGRENIVDETIFGSESYSLYFLGNDSIYGNFNVTDVTEISTKYPYLLSNNENCELKIGSNLEVIDDCANVSKLEFNKNISSSTDKLLDYYINNNISIQNKMNSPSFSDLSEYVFTNCTGELSNGKLLINFATSGNVKIPLRLMSDTLYSYMLIRVSGNNISTNYRVRIINNNSSNILVDTASAINNTSKNILSDFINTSNEDLYLRISASNDTSLLIDYVGILDSEFYGKNIGRENAFNIMMKGNVSSENII